MGNPKSPFLFSLHVPFDSKKFSREAVYYKFRKGIVKKTMNKIKEPI